jgi:hypothetical protein
MTLRQSIVGNVGSFKWVRRAAWFLIISYYVVSYLFIYADRTGFGGRILEHNGVLDKLTSWFWAILAAVLIPSLLYSASKRTLKLSQLAEYYLFFIFLFDFLYGLLEWHYPGSLTPMRASDYSSELQYFLFSIGIQTGSDVSVLQSGRLGISAIAGVQALVGVGFLAWWVALAVNKQSSS